MGRGWEGWSSNERDQPWLHERTNNASFWNSDLGKESEGLRGGVVGVERELEEEDEAEEGLRDASESEEYSVGWESIHPAPRTTSWLEGERSWRAA